MHNLLGMESVKRSRGLFFYFEYFSLIVYFLQLCAFPFTVGSAIPWPDTPITTILSATQLTIPSVMENTTIYLLLFWLFFAITACTIAFFGLVASGSCDCLENEFSENASHFFLTRVLLGILFLPICRIFLAIFVLEDIPVVALHAVVAVISLLCLFVLAVFKAAQENDASHIPSQPLRVSKSVSYLHLRFLSYRLLLAIIAVAALSSPILLSLLLAAASPFIPLYIVLKLPFVLPFSRDMSSRVDSRAAQRELRSPVNIITSSLGAFASWIGICGIIAVLIGDSDETVIALAITPLGIAPAILVGMLVLKRMKRKDDETKETSVACHTAAGAEEAAWTFWIDVSDKADQGVVAVSVEVDKDIHIEMDDKKEEAVQDEESPTVWNVNIHLRVDKRNGFDSLCSALEGEEWPQFLVWRKLVVEGGDIWQVATGIGKDSLEEEEGMRFGSAIAGARVVHSRLFKWPMENEVCSSFASAIGRSPQMERVEFHSCALKDDAARLIVDSLLENEGEQASIVVIDLNDNPLSREFKDEMEVYVKEKTNDRISFHAF